MRQWVVREGGIINSKVGIHYSPGLGFGLVAKEVMKFL